MMLRWLLLATLMPVPALAQGIDLSQGGPIDITAQNGIEWQQNQHRVIASGNATAVRQNVTVDADRLIAYYRKKTDTTATSAAGTQAAAPAATAPASASASPSQPGLAGDEDTSGNEIYRVEAEGHVVIFTPTDRAQGDHAVYDLDQAVMVMTGHDLRLTTPNDVITARDDLEYWAQKHMAVARGDAVVVTKDARRIAADVLVAYTTPAPATPPVPTPVAAKPAAPSSAADPLAASGKLEKVEAFGHVSIRTPTDVVTGDRGVYVPETGIAILVGDVRITRGENQLAGVRAEVNLKTGVSRLLSGNSNRVQGLIVPDDNTNGSLAGPAGQPGKRRKNPAWKNPAWKNPVRRTTVNAAAFRLVTSATGLAATGVGKTYRKRPVVRNVSVTLRRGEAVGLLGPNGAGKTTTFYMIIGLIRPDTGAIALDGADITLLPMYRRARLGIGYLPQEASVFRGLNVEQNVMAALEVVEPDSDRRDMMLDELLAEFGISHLRRTPALALSGGERRRVEIARALATQPAYILLDEPLAGIDPIAVSEIRDLVSHLKHRGIGVLITDHNVRETLEIIDRAYIMHDGEVLMEGVPDEVVAHADVRRVYLGERFSL